MSVDVLLPCRNILGESPLWCPRRARLFWVDIRAPALYACNSDGSARASWPMPQTIGSFALTAGDAMVVALKAGFHTFDPATSRLATIVEPERERPQHRFNEGKCDPRGRFWAGSMNDSVREPTGVLYRLDPDRACHRMRTKIAVPNSLAWSPDGTKVYFADTETRQIMRHAFDLDDGTFGAAAIFADLRQHGGRPDGSTVDADGCLWNAEVSTGRVVRYAPDGREILALTLPVTRPTSVAFGGSDLRTLYITSSSYKLGPEELAAQPHAGALFATRTEVAGLPPALYGG
jgi:sugar lactone lactonase YvrE